MDRLKTLRTYFLMFAAFFIVTGTLTYFGMNGINKDMNNYVINFASPKVTIEASRVSKLRGYIRAEVKNDTGNYIDSQGIEFKFYTKEGEYLGTKTSYVRNLDLGKTEKISMEYNFEVVGKIEINLPE